MYAGMYLTTGCMLVDFLTPTHYIVHLSLIEATSHHGNRVGARAGLAAPVILHMARGIFGRPSTIMIACGHLLVCDPK